MNTPTADEIRSNYLDIVQSATFAQIMQAATWYSEAQEYARVLADKYAITLDTAAGVIAAFSPRTRWVENVKNADLFLNGDPVPTLGNNVRMANKVMIEGIPALNGRKTNSFAWNIAGNMDIVTIDVWMIRAAGYERNDANITMYNEMEDAIMELAYSFGVEAAQMQALIWIVVRGSHV
jgi:hypothetical protein